MYILCDELFAPNPTNVHLVPEEDLLFCEQDDQHQSNETKNCLLLRFKNCTGNLIRLDYE